MRSFTSLALSIAVGAVTLSLPGTVIMSRISLATIGSAMADEASPLFSQGLRDRTKWENWFSTLKGDKLTGAEFWAGQRSLPNPGRCVGSPDFVKGCNEAKARLTGPDALRKAEADYKAGWNSYAAAATTPPTVPPVPGGSPVVATRAAPPTVPPVPGGSPVVATPPPVQRPSSPPPVVVSPQMAALQQELEEARQAKSDADPALGAAQNKLQEARRAKSDADAAVKQWTDYIHQLSDWGARNLSVTDPNWNQQIKAHDEKMREANQVLRQANARAAQLMNVVPQAERDLAPAQAAAAKAAARFEAVERRQQIFVKVGAQCLDPHTAEEVRQCKRDYLIANFGTEQDFRADLGPVISARYDDLLAEEQRAAREQAALAAEQERQRQAALRTEQERQRQAALRAEQERQRQAALAAEQERQRQAALELAAEQAREQLRRQAAAERGQKTTAKMKELGFQVISSIDLELDWPDLVKNKKKIALSGDYTKVDGIDVLWIESRDLPNIRLYTDRASRDARKTMLECRETGATACPMVVGGTVQQCVANEKQINERRLPCLAVLEALPLPEGWRPVVAEQK